MLAFVKEADPIPKIKSLDDTVSAMMRQLYECALFLQKYGESRVLGNYLGI
jgi:hypothetical protein